MASWWWEAGRFEWKREREKGGRCLTDEKWVMIMVIIISSSISFAPLEGSFGAEMMHCGWVVLRACVRGACAPAVLAGVFGRTFALNIEHRPIHAPPLAPQSINDDDHLVPKDPVVSTDSYIDHWLILARVSPLTTPIHRILLPHPYDHHHDAHDSNRYTYTHPIPPDSPLHLSILRCPNSTSSRPLNAHPFRLGKSSTHPLSIALCADSICSPACLSHTLSLTLSLPPLVLLPALLLLRMGRPSWRKSRMVLCRAIRWKL